MIFIAIVITALIMLNYANPPSFWGITGCIALGLTITSLTFLRSIGWFVGWVIFIGSGYLTYNYLHNILELNIIISIIFGLVVSVKVGGILNHGPN